MARVEDFLTTVASEIAVLVHLQVLLQQPQRHEPGAANVAAVVIEMYAHVNHQQPHFEKYFTTHHAFEHFLI